jgi:hypothetical protein
MCVGFEGLDFHGVAILKPTEAGVRLSRWLQVARVGEFCVPAVQVGEYRSSSEAACIDTAAFSGTRGCSARAPTRPAPSARCDPKRKAYASGRLVWTCLLLSVKPICFHDNLYLSTLPCLV